ncbi:MAG: shikimate dehydrogenase [Verrucomicrobia bacterium]|nr:shikimate dehydrogenase [Verrucomicrobiota bacterium]
MSQEPNYKADLVGVFGHPVAENPTIVMLEAAFHAANLNWRYLTIEVLPEDLAAAVTGMRAMQFQGINLTIPHKVSVIPLLDDVESDAKLIGAVNTVRKDGNRLIGENTDGKGFLRNLREGAGMDPGGKRFVFFGAGGAARAMTVELALAGAESLTIVNRTPERGEPLAQLIRENTPAHAEFVHWNHPYSIPADTDVVVNATSIGLFPDVSEKPDIDYDSFSDSMVVCDVIPNPPQTAFLDEARLRGARTLDGLGMLVYQGAIGFTLWTGKEPPVEVMRQALAAAFD